MDRFKNRFRLINTLALCLIAYALMFGQGYAAPSTSTSAAAVGTQFVYEGQLGTVTGTYDLYFRLWDAASGGALVGSPNTNQVLDRPVTQGEYQVVLNFGSTAFRGDARYLEVRYRLSTSTGDYTVHPGRKPILPTAYALNLRPVTTVKGASTDAILRSTNTGIGIGLWGSAISNPGVYGTSSTSSGVSGISNSAPGVYGESRTNTGVVGKSNAWIGVYGESTSAFGVQGKSTTGAGTVGESRDWIGVYGVSTNNAGVRGESRNVNHGGVVGVNTAGGIAVYGSSSGVGVQGESTNNSGVVGKSQNQVGVSGQSVNGNGVSGVTGSATGVGVYGGNSGGGYAMQAAGNTTQPMTANGWVKAMAYIDPFQGSDRIRQCFNSQLPGTQATSGDCGITMAYVEKGFYKLDFNFPVASRFISVTPVARLTTGGDVSAMIELNGSDSQSFWVHMSYTSVNDHDYRAENADAAFYIIVY